MFKPGDLIYFLSVRSDRTFIIGIILTPSERIDTFTQYKCLIKWYDNNTIKQYWHYNDDSPLSSIHKVQKVKK